MTVSNNSTVKVKFADGRTKEFHFINNASEVDPDNGYISTECPVGRALLGAAVGEKRKYAVNGKEFEVEILEVIE